ncbi:MAG: PepSY-associated TM helix domain-containing protein [Kofleriaceae bacterium]
MKWRGLFRLVHRDVGSFCVALTLAYGLSGLAVNHLDDWNPSYRFETRRVELGAIPPGTPAELEAHVVRALAFDPKHVRGHVQDSDTAFRVFLVGGEEVALDLRTGSATHKTVARRAVLFQVNALHLNHLKGVWTYVADAFAIALMVLAITGMTMMKGDAGLRGRGKWFVGAGLLVPLGFILYVLQ